MSERLPQLPTYAQRLFDYYMSRPEDAESRAEYLRRGLVPTNNLSLLIVDEPDREMVPGTGIANPYDYRQKPYRHIIETLKTEQPELWERAKEATATSRDSIDAYWKLAGEKGAKTPETQKAAAHCDALKWAKAEVYTEVMHILGPQLEAEGLDPVDICG